MRTVIPMRKTDDSAEEGRWYHLPSRISLGQAGVPSPRSLTMALLLPQISREKNVISKKPAGGQSEALCMR